MDEVWKPLPIEWLSKAYEVSNLGNIRRSPAPVSQRNVNGYRQATFKYKGREVTFRVHRLVAKAFLGQPEVGQIVNHINAKRNDNKITNLEWTTPSGNVKHTYHLRRAPMGLEHHLGKIEPRTALQMRDDGHSYREIGEAFGATTQAAFNMIKRHKLMAIERKRKGI